MHEDTDDFDAGLADLVDVPLQDLPLLPRSVLDHALHRLAGQDPEQHAGFQNRA
jgi:FXSXX-COOH protein